MSIRLALPRGICVAGVLLLLAPLAGRSQSVLFLADGDASSLQAVDVTTGNILYSVASFGFGYPLAVRETLWLGHRDNTGLAVEYDPTTGLPTGGTAATTGVSISQLLDGAASATRNYAIRWSGGGVYEANPDWSGLGSTPLFTASSSPVGITYDLVNDTLWLADSSNFYQYTTAGILVSQFAHASGFGGIAYQLSTDTLWLVPNSTALPLVQYAKSGTLLQSLTVAGRSSNIYGVEFATIPEPSTWVLLALGLGILLVRRLRRG